MICQVFHWLAGAGASTLQLALVGSACLLTYDAISRWRKNRHSPADGRSEIILEVQHRRAA